MKNAAYCNLIAALMIAAAAPGLFVSPAHAHGVIGKRFLPATITVDDPFVADEASFVVGHRKMPQEENAAGTAATDEAGPPSGTPGAHTTTFSTELSKQITPDLGMTIGAAYKRVRPDDDTVPQYGFDNVALGVKYQVIKNPEHEAIMSLGVDADLGGTGSRHRVGAESFSTISPAIFYGKGFGDLPDAIKYLRPGSHRDHRSGTAHVTHGTRSAELGLYHPVQSAISSDLRQGRRFRCPLQPHDCVDRVPCGNLPQQRLFRADDRYHQSRSDVVWQDHANRGGSRHPAQSAVWSRCRGILSTSPILG